MLLKQLYELYKTSGADAVRQVLAENHPAADPDGVIAQLESIDAPEQAQQANDFIERIVKDLREHGPAAVREALQHAGVEDAMIDALLAQANHLLALEGMLKLYRDEGPDAVRSKLSANGIGAHDIETIMQHLEQS